MALGTFRGNRGKLHTKITSSTAETVIFPKGSVSLHDIYGLIISNSSASACNITIKDGVGGSTEFLIAVPAGDTRGFVLPEASAYPQNTIASDWTATCSGSVDSIDITVLVNRNS